MVFLFLAMSIISTNTIGAANYDLIPVPEFYNQSLLNGMQILLLPGGEERVPFVLMIKNGAAFDPVDKGGLSHITTWMILEELQSRNGMKIQEEMSRLDVHLDFNVKWDAIYLSGEVSRGHLVDALTLLAEMVIHPDFTEETFERLNLQLEEEVEVETDRMDIRTQQLFAAKLFKENPYGRSIKGTPRTIRNLTLRDVRVHHRKLFVPNQAQLALYYTGERSQIFRDLSRRWGSWVRKDPLPFTFRKSIPSGGRQIYLLEGSSPHGILRLGKLGGSRDSVDYYALKILEQYLTLSFPSWSDKVAQSEQSHIVAKVETRRMPGYLELSIQGPPAQLLNYYREFENLVTELIDGRVDVSQLEEAKRLAYLDLVNSLQNPVSRLYQLLETNLFNVGVNFISSYGPHLDRVTFEIFKEAVQQYVSLEEFVLVLAGPWNSFQHELEEMGRVVLVLE